MKSLQLLAAFALLILPNVANAYEDPQERIAQMEQENASLRKENALLRERLKADKTREKRTQGNISVSGQTQMPSVDLSKVYAADLPSAPYVPPPRPVYDWTGFYIGANVGVGVGRNETNTLFGTPDSTTREHFTFSPLGVIGGVQLGYNWQTLPNWVLGVETDFQASGQKNSWNCASSCNVVPEVTSETWNEKVKWFGTVRGRAGYTYGPALFYVTGGYAYGKIETSYGISGSAGQFVGSFDETRSGWTVGGGIEAQFGGNWTAKAEYLYLDLGTVNNLILPATNVLIAQKSDITDHIFRLGLNYKFGPAFVR
jgi:outer membrane immunogenic protein